MMRLFAGALVLALCGPAPSFAASEKFFVLSADQRAADVYRCRGAKKADVQQNWAAFRAQFDPQYLKAAQGFMAETRRFSEEGRSASIDAIKDMNRRYEPHAAAVAALAKTFGCKRMDFVILR